MPQLQMNASPLASVDLLPAVGEADVVVIVTDHSAYSYGEIVDAARVVLDTRNATRGIVSKKIRKI